MSMWLIGGAAALLLLLVLGLLALRRRKPIIEKPREEPVRRRAAGLIAGEATPELAEPEPDMPAEPRRKVDIGLSAWDSAEVAAPVAEDRDEEESAEEQPIEADEETNEVESPPDLAPPVEAPFDDPFIDEVAPPPPIGDDDPPSIMAQLKTKKKTGANALAGAVEGAASSAPAGPSEVEETVSLVLRRQVPPRFDEEPRSWLGGLPRMPDHVEWPRSVSPEQLDEGEVPLNFVAQIDCSEFPAELWAGLGPRSGWLLFFLNPLDSQGDDPRVFRVLYIDELGPERMPPDDLRPVISDDYADGDYRWCRSADEAPALWRRWPVDFVTVPNEAHDDGYRMVVTPKNFATPLYDGAAVTSGAPMAEDVTPFSWRGALYVVDSILRQLAHSAPSSGVGPALREALDRPNYVASIIPELRARETDWLNEGEGAILLKEEPLRERERELRDRIQPIAEERQRRLDRLAAFIVEHPNGAAIAKRIDADNAREGQWRREAAERLEAIRAQILEHQLDAPLDAKDWTALSAALDADRFSRWSVEWTSRNSDFPVMVAEQDRSLLDLAGPGIEAAVVEVAADYQADPELRQLVPPGLLDRLEPHWRALTDNRPHRIGGFHDGLQSEPEDGPQGELLLLQIASDDAMHWSWGDSGAYFIFITPRDLAAGRFDRAEIRLEQP